MMDTQIFKLKLSVHGTSLYILISDLVQGGIRPTMEEIGLRFNASGEDTLAALAELLTYKVLYENRVDPEKVSYHPNPASLWELPLETSKKD
ncbi:MAG: hypothetical protein LBE38_01055 [Deltaproteobacteria bacterium]|jgi:hypothetical protein|nr:hypothetical protein [Deltaproteobacteria bacterium]